MTIPGVITRSGEDPTSSSPAVDIGTWFVTGLAERGSITEPVLIRSISEYGTKLGARVTYGLLYDSLQTFFEEGGAEAYVGRVVGPTPVTATATAKTGGGESTLKISATSPGAWGNDIDVVIAASEGNNTYTVKYLGTVVEESPAVADNTAAVTWAAGSDYVRFEDLGKGDPAAATKELASGDDDRANITEAQWTAALALFAADFGTGQVSAPGHTTAEGQTKVLLHGETHNRVAVLDGTDTHTVATLKSQATTLRALATARYGGLFAPWAVIPGLTTGTTRTVPYSAVEAGLMARNDGLGLNPNEPASGENGIARYATGLSQVAWTDTERGELNDAGVNVALIKFGKPRTYGYRTLVNPLTLPTFVALSNARLTAFIKAKAAVIGERFKDKQIGRKTPAKFGTAIEGEVLKPLLDDEALFGDTESEAYEVVIGEPVNTTESIGERKLAAKARVVESTFAEVIEIDIVQEAL